MGIAVGTAVGTAVGARVGTYVGWNDGVPTNIVGLEVGRTSAVRTLCRSDDEKMIFKNKIKDICCTIEKYMLEGAYKSDSSHQHSTTKNCPINETIVSKNYATQWTRLFGTWKYPNNQYLGRNNIQKCTKDVDDSNQSRPWTQHQAKIANQFTCTRSYFYHLCQFNNVPKLMYLCA